ncbi:unnamed protein product (macronuclear) [Paramecium tetraurelia]|uniref:Uncharacterized protein n=1 Tax=Paramecium tetraurelia TaxID=5888 RepID=A0C092_PARTE|nr:uncharacterized protein GSPATT00006062001 [Paramecium tetraurelia]CAK64209.1 unnamed protein product [Paramecium tetraurelia]|eukprot:XP_001431607.1 hypothetical protein (macronuclear) [Paramecium tetraurelia strain d4-2]
MNFLEPGSHELIQRRQQAKLDFLLSENRSLKQENDLLLLTLQKYRTNQLNEIFSFEIQQLNQQVTSLKEQLTHSQVQAFLNLQLSQQIEAFYLDLVHEQEDKILEQRRIIHDKEYTIQQQEKNNTVLNDGVAVKCKDLLQLNEISLKLHNEIEHLKNELLKHNQYIQHYQVKIKQLNNENSTYKFELLKFRKALRNQVTFRKVKESLMNEYEQDLSDTELSSFSNNGQSTTETRQINTSISTQKCHELERYKKLFEQQVTTNHILQGEYNKIYKQNQQLLVTNERLCMNSQTQNKKLEKLKNEIIYLEQFWQASLNNTTNQIIKYSITYPDESKLLLLQRSQSCKQLEYSESTEMKEFKNYLLQLHRELYSKNRKILISRCVSEPPRFRQIKLTKKKKHLKEQHQGQQAQDLSMIHKKDLSQLSECIF